MDARASLFSAAQLKTLAETTLVDIPDGHTNAIVGTVDASGAQIVASFKLGADRRWQITAAGVHAWNGDTTAAASVIYSW
jgi:hypothetical protein